jgi:DEAD/DEAH box helicase domain-containing protein
LPRIPSPLLPPPKVSLLLAEAVQHGLRTIAFCKTRKLTEMVSKYGGDTLRLSAPALAGTLRVYRGGYAPQERRAIEAGLHSGAVAGVAATNALELGVDIGGLDVTLHLVGGRGGAWGLGVAEAG